MKGQRDERVFEEIFHGQSATDKEFEDFDRIIFGLLALSSISLSIRAGLGLEPVVCGPWPSVGDRLDILDNLDL